MFMRAIGLLLAVAALLPAGTIYSVTDLGGLGGSSSMGFAINSSGSVAGWSQTPSGDQHAFLFSNGSLQDLSPNLNADSFAGGINATGTVVGTTYIDGQPHGTVWGSSVVTDLGPGTFATGINDAGVIIGGNGHAFLFSNGVYHDLGVLPGGDWSSAYGVNNLGTVVGNASTAAGGFRGFLWTAASGMVALPTFGGANSYATAINNNGEAAGFASLVDGYEHAFSALNAVLTDLGTLGGRSSFAYGINDDGNIVGFSWMASGANPHAFLYSNGMMVDLNSLIPASSGWELTQAFGINDAGQIVGQGLFHGQLEAFRLDPHSAESSVSTISTTATPEPTCLGSAAIGLALIALGARRKSKPPQAAA